MTDNRFDKALRDLSNTIASKSRRVETDTVGQNVLLILRERVLPLLQAVQTAQVAFGNFHMDDKEYDALLSAMVGLRA